MDSLFSKKASRFGIHLIEDSSVLEICYESLEDLYIKYTNFERIGRILATKGYLDEVERTKTFQTMTSSERYKLMLVREPYLLHRVPLGYIASYLGMTQVQLSRVRKISF